MNHELVGDNGNNDDNNECCRLTYLACTYGKNLREQKAQCTFFIKHKRLSCLQISKNNEYQPMFMFVHPHYF